MRIRLAREEDYAAIARLHRQTIRNVNSKDYVGKGIGSRLLKVAEDSLKKHGCKRITLKGTVTAKAFYQKQGYKVIKKSLHPVKDKKLEIFIMAKMFS